MKNTNYKVNHTNSTIIITKDFADKASIVNTAEYKILCQLKKDFPNYTVSQRTAKVSTKRDYHKDLTIPRMEKFISWFDENGMNKFLKVKEYFQTTKGYSASVRAWFLSNYPDYKEQEMMFECAYDATLQIIEESEAAKMADQTTKPADENAEEKTIAA